MAKAERMTQGSLIVGHAPSILVRGTPTSGVPRRVHPEIPFMLMNFDNDIDTAARLVTEAAAVTETITSRPVVAASRQDLLQDGGSVDWHGLRDYVCHQIESQHGSWPRDPKKEAGIFKGFLSRWGDEAMPISRAAFEVYGGFWNSAPISVTRFCKGSDVWFSQPIADALRAL